jgi:hypothetical protein
VSEDDVESRPVWNANLAKELPGKLILVGLTYFESDGSCVEQQQFFGRVTSAHERTGILLDLEGQRAGEKYNLPPDMRSLFEADPGEYRLRTTGETVTDPDFTVTFALHKQAK